MAGYNVDALITTRPIADDYESQPSKLAKI